MLIQRGHCYGLGCEPCESSILKIGSGGKTAIDTDGGSIEECIGENFLQIKSSIEKDVACRLFLDTEAVPFHQIIFQVWDNEMKEWANTSHKWNLQKA